MATPRAKFVFQAVDQTKAATASVRKNVKSVEKGFAGIRKNSLKTSKAIKKNFRAAEVALGKLGSKAKAVGRDLTLKMTAPVVGLGFAVLKVAAGFEAGMNRVQAKTGATGKAFEALRDQAKSLGSTTQFSARQAAEGQEILATAGFKSAEILSALPGVLDLAASGQLEMGEAARYVAGTLAGFNKEAEHAGRVSDVLAKGALLADQTVGDLGAGMAKASTTANAAGHSLEGTAAALSVLAQKGRRAEEGGTALRNFLLELQNPAAKSRVAIERMGYSITNADGSLKSMTNILSTFNAAGYTAANAAEIFTKRTSDTFQVLESGQSALKGYTAELVNNADGTAKALAAANLKGLAGEFTKLKSALEGVAIAIAESGLLEWITNLAARFAKLASRLSETSPHLLRIGTLVALAAAAIGPMILAVGALASSLGALVGAPATFAAISATLSGLAVAIGPVLLAVAAVVAVVVALVAAFRSGATWIETVKGLFATAAADITTVLVPAFRIVADIFNNLILPALKTVGEAIITTLAVTFRIVATVLKVTLGPILEALADWLGVVMPKVINVATKAWAGFVKFFRTAASKILQFIGATMGLLAKLPGAVGEGFADGQAKIEEFAAAVGDLDTPIAEAVAGVTSFAESVGQADEDTANPFAALLERLRLLTAVGGETAAVVNDLGGDDTPAPVVDPEDTIEPAKRALFNLEKVGRRVKASLETGLASAMTNLHHPITAVTDLFRSLWMSVIQEIAKQLAIRLTASILSTFAGGPLGFLAQGLAGAAGREAPAGPALITNVPNNNNNQTPAGGVVNVYQTLVPPNTADRARAGRATRSVQVQADRFILGPAVG